MDYEFIVISALLICSFLALRSILLVLVDVKESLETLNNVLTSEDFEEEVFHVDGFVAETSSKLEVDSAISEFVVERERAFNERIARIKDEIGLQGTEAAILHPDVENLPHDSVMQQRDLPEEYAE